MLRAWGDAPAFVLSCPGPLRRHTASLLPLAGLVLPQCLLGGEAQLLAFAAASPSLAGRFFFAPLPEVFAGQASLQAAWQRCGEPDHPVRRLVHLRFGSTRMARVLKSARNGSVVAEHHGAGPLTASHHPFASGLALPAAMRRIFVYDALGAGSGQQARPHALTGEVLPASRLPPECLSADLVHALARRRRAEPDDDGDGEQSADPGLDIVAFGDFRSYAWAAGPVRGRAQQLRATLRMAREGSPFVLLPWNMDHPGSIVPELLDRLARLQDPMEPQSRILVMPFNYLGQTGIIRKLVARVREAAGDDRMLEHIYLGRLSRLVALRLLLQIAPVAWVDVNDPEQAWTMARLAAAGLTPILLGAPEEGDPARIAHFACDETIRIEADTRYGALSFPAILPSRRSLPGLLALTRSLQGDRAEKSHSSRSARAGSPKQKRAS